MNYFVYILRTSSNTLYIGQTNNLERRIEQHLAHKGAKYMKYFTSFELIYSEKYSSRIKAMKREAELKKWRRAEKDALVKNYLDSLKNLSKSTKIVKSVS